MRPPMIWNRVIYRDCMDPEYGLPSLPDKSIDLCLTDPPYNINFKGAGNLKTKKIFYDDKMEDDEYIIWCDKWYKELKRTCNFIIISPGLNNLRSWYIRDNFKLAIWYSPEKQGHSKNSKLSKIEPFLTFGLKKPNWLYSNHFKFFKGGKHGFFNRDRCFLKHPCPKSFHLWFYLISCINPKSVIDPFIGSGTTAEVCTKLGIKWLGYELNEVYSQDINKRLKNCKKEPVQQYLL